MGDLDKGKCHGACRESEEYKDELDLVPGLACTVISGRYLWPYSFSSGMRNRKEGESGTRGREMGKMLPVHI